MRRLFNPLQSHIRAVAPQVASNRELGKPKNYSQVAKSRLVYTELVSHHSQIYIVHNLARTGEL